MDRILLTIAIPTYKRCKYAVQNVKHLLPQVNAHRDKVRLIVTDNHSEDGTSEALTEISRQNDGVFKFYEQKEHNEDHFLFEYYKFYLNHYKLIHCLDF